MTEPPKTTTRRRIRFSLRTLFVSMLVVGVGLGLFARNMQLAERQRRAVAALEAGGFSCSTNEWESIQSGKSWRPDWLLELLGKDFFFSVKSVYGTQVESFECLSCLRDLPQLEKLNVYNSPGDRITPYLSDLAQLKELDLSNCHLSDAGLEHLRGLTALEVLWVANNPVTGAGLIHLDDSRNLRSLHAELARFNDAGMQNLARLTHLSLLIVSGTPELTDEGLALLRPMTSMEILMLDDCGFSGNGLAHLSGMRYLETLSLDGSHGVGDAGLSHLAELSHLRLLRLVNCGITDDGLDCIGRLTDLEVLRLDGNRITSDGLAHLKRLSKLTVLNLSDTQVDDGCWEYLQNYPFLDSLQLDRCNVSGAGLQLMPQLRSLDLNGVTLTNSLFSQLAQSDVKYLILNGTNLDIVGLRKLSAMKQLEHLSAVGCVLDDSALDVLKTFPKLQGLYVGIGVFSSSALSGTVPFAVQGNDRPEFPW